MSIVFKGEKVEIYTQPIQWMEFEKYTHDLEENHRANIEFGFTGSLCYLNHHDYFDPWQLAGKQVLETQKKPLIAVNPVYHHPYIVARSVFTISQWLDGPVALNFIAGTSTNDLTQIGEMATKEQRYQRLDEFITVLKKFLGEPGSWSYNGKFYQIENASFNGQNSHMPDLFLAGHSRQAEKVNNHQQCINARSLLSSDILMNGEYRRKALGFGIYLADTSMLAKQQLSHILKIDKTSQVLHRLKMNNTDGRWKADQQNDLQSTHPNDLYFPEAIQSAANVPFLTGATAEVGTLLSQFLSKGCRHFILPMVSSANYRHVRLAFESAGCSFL